MVGAIKIVSVSLVLSYIPGIPQFLHPFQGVLLSPMSFFIIAYKGLNWYVGGCKGIEAYWARRNLIITVDFFLFCRSYDANQLEIFTRAKQRQHLAS